MWKKVKRTQSVLSFIIHFFDKLSRILIIELVIATTTMAHNTVWCAAQHRIRNQQDNTCKNDIKNICLPWVKWLNTNLPLFHSNLDKASPGNKIHEDLVNHHLKLHQLPSPPQATRQCCISSCAKEATIPSDIDKCFIGRIWFPVPRFRIYDGSCAEIIYIYTEAQQPTTELGFISSLRPAEKADELLIFKLSTEGPTQTTTPNVSARKKIKT